jgi:hypothetical protein
MPQKPASASGAEPPRDSRESKAALDITRGTSRCLLAHGFARVTELTLANGRRADLAAVNASGRIWIVEVKSSLADFRSDQKWHEYTGSCDQFYFAVGRDFPVEVLPLDAGLIVADAYGGEIVRSCTERVMAGATRREVILRLARTAALRLHALADPASSFEQ